jgi:hypothetical protein
LRVTAPEQEQSGDLAGLSSSGPSKPARPKVAPREAIAGPAAERLAKPSPNGQSWPDSGKLSSRPTPNCTNMSSPRWPASQTAQAEAFAREGVEEPGSPAVRSSARACWPRASRRSWKPVSPDPSLHACAACASWSKARSRRSRREAQPSRTWRPCAVGIVPLRRDARRLGVGLVGGSSSNWSGLPPRAPAGTHDVVRKCNGVNESYLVLINFSNLARRWISRNHWARCWCAARDSNPEPAD